MTYFADAGYLFGCFECNHKYDNNTLNKLWLYFVLDKTYLPTIENPQVLEQNLVSNLLRLKTTSRQGRFRIIEKKAQRQAVLADLHQFFRLF